MFDAGRRRRVGRAVAPNPSRRRRRRRRAQNPEDEHQAEGREAGDQRPATPGGGVRIGIGGGAASGAGAAVASGSAALRRLPRGSGRFGWRASGAMTASPVWIFRARSSASESLCRWRIASARPIGSAWPSRKSVRATSASGSEPRGSRPAPPAPARGPRRPCPRADRRCPRSSVRARSGVAAAPVGPLAVPSAEAYATGETGGAGRGARRLIVWRCGRRAGIDDSGLDGRGPRPRGLRVRRRGGCDAADAGSRRRQAAVRHRPRWRLRGSR